MTFILLIVSQLLSFQTSESEIIYILLTVFEVRNMIGNRNLTKDIAQCKDSYEKVASRSVQKYSAIGTLFIQNDQESPAATLRRRRCRQENQCLELRTDLFPSPKYSYTDYVQLKYSQILFHQADHN